MFINNFKTKKVTDYLNSKSNGKVLFIFQHGLGDVINFLPIIEELKKRYSEWEFKVGVKSDYCFLHSSLIPLDNFRKLIQQFTYVFNIGYPEPLQERFDFLCKPYLCNQMEIGLENYTWKPFKMNSEIKFISKLVGVHLFGNTNQKKKSLDKNLAEIVWKEIEDSGFIPYEIHNEKYNVNSLIDQGLEFIKPESSLRFNNPTLKDIVNKIKECEFFIGIDSGPFYLAGSILGYNRVIGLEKDNLFKHYIPIKINSIDIKDYQKGSVKKTFQELRRI